MTMQRWEVLHGHVHPVGRHAPRTVKIMVLASDAEAAIAAAEQRWRESNTFLHFMDGYEEAERNTLARCIAAVESLREEYVGDEYAQGELALRVALAALRGLDRTENGSDQADGGQ